MKTKKYLMKKIFLSILSAAFFAISTISCEKDKPLTSESKEVSVLKDGTRYKIDTINSKIEWKGYKIVKSEQTSHFGTIKFESGDVTVKNGQLQSGKFVADMNTLSNVDLKDDQTKKSKLIGHLKSGDFFEVEKFPTASYEITKISYATNNGDYNSVLDGNLTIKGITKPVQFSANISVKDGAVSIATEPKDIDRQDFGVKFQMPFADGAIKDVVNLQISVKALGYE